MTTSWFEGKRHAIFEALSNVCDQIDDDLAQELDRREQQHKTALRERDESLKNASTQLDRFKDENSRLKLELQEANKTSSPQPHESTRASGQAGRNPQNAAFAGDEPDWKSEYAKLSRKYKALSDVFKKAKEALRKRKDERDRWIDHASLLEKRVKIAEEEHGITIIDSKNRSSRVPNNVPARTETSKTDPSASFAFDAALEQTDLELPPLAAASLETENDTSGAARKTANPQLESTQGSSESRPDDELPFLPEEAEVSGVRIKEEPSSDGPIVVSERPVRKRKRDEPQAFNGPIRKVKVELGDSSSPVRSLRRCEFELQESIDLGEVAQRILTPRKRKELEETRLNRELAEDILAATTTTPAPLFIRPDPDPQSVRAPPTTSVLTPMSINRRTEQAGADKLKPTLEGGLSHGISTLADDGDVYQREPSRSLVNPPSTAKSTAKGRLDTLLNSPSSTAEPAISRVKPQQRERREKSRLATDDLPVPERRELPFERGRRVKDKVSGLITPASCRPNLPSHLTSDPETSSPLAHKKPAASLLRNKPLSELRLDDFKINPLVNDGQDFAFSEVVRDKDERACLPGCVNMHCCGKQFRALAISQRPNPPLTAAQRQEEQKLLEDYLGDLAYRLSTMSKEERKDLWIEAKTQELANRYGKHRHRYSRMQSPPGFWNPDFPSTQELEANRAEAQKREKQAIQERYREAIRPGGRWIFRDE